MHSQNKCLVVLSTELSLLDLNLQNASIQGTSIRQIVKASTNSNCSFFSQTKKQYNQKTDSKPSRQGHTTYEVHFDEQDSYS